jgi:hypothetical protein
MATNIFILILLLTHLHFERIDCENGFKLIEESLIKGLKLLNITNSASNIIQNIVIKNPPKRKTRSRSKKFLLVLNLRTPKKPNGQLGEIIKTKRVVIIYNSRGVKIRIPLKKVKQ